MTTKNLHSSSQPSIFFTYTLPLHLLHKQLSSLLPSNLHHNSSQNCHKSSSISSTAIPSQQSNHSNPIKQQFHFLIHREYTNNNNTKYIKQIIQITNRIKQTDIDTSP